jgi:hypothetical protein
MKLGSTNFVMWIKRLCINEDTKKAEEPGIEQRDTFRESSGWLATDCFIMSAMQTCLRDINWNWPILMHK